MNQASLVNHNPLLTWQGTVIDGEKVGRTIGFPTANLDRVPTEDQLKPGVYLASCQLNHQSRQAIVYFGPRYIFHQINNVFEVHILDFNQSIYGQKLDVELFQFIRHPIKFSNINDLKDQLALDLNTALALLKS